MIPRLIVSSNEILSGIIRILFAHLKFVLNNYEEIENYKDKNPSPGTKEYLSDSSKS